MINSIGTRIEWSKCGGCWKGYCLFALPDPKSGNYKVWVNCDVCGLPGDKPAASIYRGELYDYYVNHGNTWQSYSLGPVEDRPKDRKSRIQGDT